MHEVVVTKRTIDAIKLASEQNYSLWRVSSTVSELNHILVINCSPTGHIASDAVLNPLGHFAESPLASKYPPKCAGEFVEQELAIEQIDDKRGLLEQGQGTVCGSTFFSALVQLIPCRPSFGRFSPIPPSEACCNAIKVLGQPCLCVLVNGPPVSGVDWNMALQQPDKNAVPTLNHVFFPSLPLYYTT
ncbi:hypothetical protein REPUB_Repub12eG0218300 [Reevesia pubescens]